MRGLGVSAKGDWGSVWRGGFRREGFWGAQMLEVGNGATCDGRRRGRCRWPRLGGMAALGIRCRGEVVRVDGFGPR